RFAMIQNLVMGTVALLIAQGADVSPWLFRGLLLTSCLAAGAGVFIYSGIRVRRHRKLVRDEREGHERPSLNPSSLVRVLRDNPDYAAFMGALFVIGTGNLALTAPLTLTLADQFGLSAFASMIVTSGIPLLVQPFVIPFW